MNYKTVLAQVLAVSTLAFSFNTHAQDLTGAGSTFFAPLAAKWADTYAKSKNVKVNYQSVGSGAGIKQIKTKTVDFGASDMPLTDDELSKEGLVQFPVVIGGVVPVVNIANIKPGQIKLTGPVLADIFLGNIKKWNDKAIVSLNAGVALPDADIAVVRRADGSGTSFLFTNYLSKVSPDWKSKVGEGTAVNWPVGAGGKGNEGVSAFVNRLPNSIGYVEYSYSKQNKMSHVALQNAANMYVQPSDDAFKAASANAQWNKSFYQVLTQQAGKEAWPISGAVFVLMHAKQDKPVAASAALKFFEWTFKNGDQMADELDYVPLPNSVKNVVEQSWSKITDASGKAIAYK